MVNYQDWIEMRNQQARETLDFIRKLEIERDAARQRVAELERVLAEIAKGEGAFSLDPLKHASNTIDHMKALAEAALSGEEGE